MLKFELYFEEFLETVTSGRFDIEDRIIFDGVEFTFSRNMGFKTHVEEIVKESQNSTIHYGKDITVWEYINEKFGDKPLEELLNKKIIVKMF